MEFDFLNRILLREPIMQLPDKSKPPPLAEWRLV
jgi:hypothetical protein